jgi:glycosyltransferase involved in cell wall biosynthesis
VTPLQRRDPAGPSVNRGSSGDGGAVDAAGVLDFLAPWLAQQPSLAIDRPISREAIEVLCRDQRIAGIVLRALDQAPPILAAERRGHFHDPPYDWSLPRRRSTLLAFFGPRRRITAAMLRTARQAGIRRIVYAGPDGACIESTARLLGARAVERARHEVMRRVPWLEPIAGRATLRRLRTWLPAATLPHPTPRRPRVVLANHSLSMGGTERQLVGTAASLRRRGIDDITVLCERRRDYGAHDPFGSALEAMGVPIVEIPDAIDPAHAQGLGGYRRAARHLPGLLVDDALCYASVLLQLRPDVVHAWQDGSNVKAGLGAVLAGVPRIVLALRSMPPNLFDHGMTWMWPGYRALAERDNVAIIGNSRAVARAYAQWLDLPHGRIATIPNAVEAGRWARRDDRELATFRARHSLGREPVVGSIFRFYPEKDPMLWLRSCAAIAARRPDVRFLLVGEGPMRRRMEAEAARLGLSDRLRLAGELVDPSPALAAMDVFLLASAFEGLPNVVLEAQAAGVPVVAARAGGVEEALDAGRTGFLVTERRPEALAACVLRALADGDWAAAARAAGPRFIAAQFDPDLMVGRLLAAYGLDAP